MHVLQSNMSLARISDMFVGIIFISDLTLNKICIVKKKKKPD